MTFVVSRYNQDVEWLKEYTDNPIIYDRSEEPIENSIIVPNLGTDIADKFSYIIDNYDNLPDVAVYTKANIFKYISEEEFNQIKDNKIFTPLLTKHHKVYAPICWYNKEGMYCELNDYWYLNAHPARYAKEIIELFKMNKRGYNIFAPGSNYLLPKENILKHPKEFYEKLRSYLMWDRYPGEAQLLERNLWYIWR